MEGWTVGHHPVIHFTLIKNVAFYGAQLSRCIDYIIYF